MLKRLLSVCAGLLLALTVFAATRTDLANGHPDRYVVQKGDTLWDISARFLNKPWLWPEIWQANPQVKNPHLIYPGDELVLAYGADGRAYVTHGRGSIEPHARALPLGEAVRAIPLSVIKQYLHKTRILTEDEGEHAPHVVGLEENRLRSTPGQLVYIRGLDAQPGQLIAILRPQGRYYDMPPEDDGRPREVYRQSPDERDGRPSMLWRHGPNEFTMHGNIRFLGYEALEFATAEVTRAGSPASALVTNSDFEIRVGDWVLPIDPHPYDDEYLPHAPRTVPANMRVIAFSDALAAVGTHQVVALSRGHEDGVENGQTFSIYHPGDVVVDNTDYPQGSFRAALHPHDKNVQLPEEYIGHVMIFRTFDRVSYGLVMDGVRPVHLADVLHGPDETP